MRTKSAGDPEASMSDPGLILADPKMLGFKHEEPALVQLNATVRLGTVHTGRGIEITCSGERDERVYLHHKSTGRARMRDTGLTVVGSLDVHGAALFRALPGGLGSLADMLLPLKVHFKSREYGKMAETYPHERHTLSFTLGARRLTHTTLISTLWAIVDAGDPVFVFELRGTVPKNGGTTSPAPLLGYLPTKCSLILSALGSTRPKQHGETPLVNTPKSAVCIRYDGALPRFRRSMTRLVLGWMRWWLCGLLFAVGCWCALVRPDPLLTYAPPLLSNTSGAVSFRSVLPPHPRNRTAAYALGGLHHDLVHAEANGNDTRIVDDILSQASAWSDGENVTVASLHNMADVIADMDAHVGVVARVTGLFTFVNIMWCVGIVGLCVSIGPAIYAILKPLQEMLARAVRWIYDHVIVPTVKRLHTWGVFETLAFVVAYLLVLQGFRMHRDSGVYVTLTGAVLALPCMGYSTLLRGKRCSQRALTQCMQAWLFCCSAPLAVALDSHLIGYLAVAALYGAVGFSIMAGRLCLFIGFSSEDALKRAVLVSVLLVVAFTTLHVSASAPYWLLPFAPAVSVLGNIVMLLGLMILSSTLYRDKYYYVCNALMCTSLLALQFVGHVFGLVGMANVATVFMVLFALDKYAEWHYESRYDGWVLMLILSAATWRLALAAHEHPAYIASLFQAY